MAEPFAGANGDQASLPPDAEVFVRDPHTGNRGVVKRSELEKYIAHGYQLETPEQTTDTRLEHEYGDRPLAAAAQGAASTITFGGSDIVLNELDPEGARETKKRNALGYGLGAVGGALLGGGVGAGGLLTRAGIGAEKALVGAGAGLSTRVLGGAVRGGVEGVGYGVGTGIGEVALDDKPLTWEGAAATIGSNALGGAAVGGVIGGGAKLLAEGATAARNIANKQVEAITKPAEAVERGAYPELAGMDSKATSKAIVAEDGLIKEQKAATIAETTAAQKAEVERLGFEQQNQAKALYSDAEKYAIENPFIDPGDDAMAAVQLGHADTKLKKATDNRASFHTDIGRKKYAQFQEGLQEQETVLERLTKDADQVMANADAERQAFHESIPRPKVPAYEELPLDASHVAKVTAKDLEARGLFELPGAGVDEARMARVKGNLGKAEEWNQPIRLTMDEDGRLFIEDGRHRLHAALEEGGGRELQVEIDRGSRGFDAAANGEQLGGAPSPPRPSGFSELPGAVPGEEAAGRGRRPKFGFRGQGEAPAATGTYLSPPQARAYAEWAGLPKPEAGLAVGDAELAKFRAAVEMGDVLPPNLKRMQRAQELLAKNRAMQERFAQIAAKPTSKTLDELALKLEQTKHDATPTPRLQALKAHQADLQTPKGLGHTIAQGMGGAIGGSLGHAVGGPLGSIAGAFVGRDVGLQVFEKLTSKLARSNAQRGKVIKAAVARMFAKGAGATAKVLPNATKIIPAIQYSSPKYAQSQLGPDDMKPSKDATVTAFRQRARELNSVTERSALGGFQPRMPALADMHDRMAALWQIAPAVANGIEKLQAAKWAFLASKLPRNPAPPTLQLGPDNWEPSKQQMSLFARYMEVAERPEAAVERLADGTISPGDVETLKAVWPAHYDQIRQECMNHAATLRETLPYVQRLNLSILLDVDVDPALTPAAMQVFQAPAPPPPEPSRPAGPTKPLPTGMVEPTQAQRMSSK